jgi:hypothetical protein
MDSRLNIPAPTVVKLRVDICLEQARRLKMPSPQGDVEATAKADPAKNGSRKFSKCSHGCPYRKPTQVGE